MTTRTSESITKCLADQASIVYPKVAGDVTALTLADLRAAAEPEAQVLASIWPLVGQACRDRCNTRAVRRTIQRAYGLALDA